METSSFARGEDAAQIAHDMVASGQTPKMERGRVIPRFFIHRVAKEDGTLHEMECVELLLPGDTKTAPIKKVTDALKQIYAPEYEAWKMNKPMEHDGVSLDLWLGRDDPRIRELNHHRIYTVEQMADISDTVAQGIMGGMSLRDKSKEFVERRTGPSALAEENDKLKVEMAEMKSTLDALAEVVSGKKADGDQDGVIIKSKDEVIESLSEDTPEAAEVAKTSGPSDGYEVKRGKGCFKVVNGDGDEVFSAPTKAECAAWKVDHETAEKGE